MSLPKSVQDAAEKAEALQQQLVNPSTEDTHPEEQQNQQPVEEQSAQVQPEPAPEPAEAPAAQPEPQSAEPSFDHDATYWQHRFQVLQGKYNAEVPALRAEVAELKAAVEQANSQVAQEQGSAQQRALDAVSDLSQEEMEEFGPELVQLIQKVVGAQTQQVSQQLDQANATIREMQEDKQQAEEEKQQDAQARFWTDLTQLAPNWRTLNDDVAFLQWLDGFDPVSSTQRQILLNSAQKKLDANGVAAVFNAFTQAAPPPAADTQTPEHLQQPPQSRASEPAQQSTRSFTRAEISQFYKDVKLKRYTPEEAAAIEKEIFEAQAHNNVF